MRARQVLFACLQAILFKDFASLDKILSECCNVFLSLSIILQWIAFEVLDRFLEDCDCIQLLDESGAIPIVHPTGNVEVSWVTFVGSMAMDDHDLMRAVEQLCDHLGTWLEECPDKVV